MCVINTTWGKYQQLRIFCVWIRTGREGRGSSMYEWSVWDVTFDQALFSVVCLCSPTLCPVFLFPFYTLSLSRSPCSINRPHGRPCLPPCHHLLWKVTWTWGPNDINHFPYTFVRWIILFPLAVYAHSSRPNLSCIFIFLSPCHCYFQMYHEFTPLH